jgi:hypothetical protein
MISKPTLLALFILLTACRAYYQGVNKYGNTYESFDDGSYTYRNKDGSVYHHNADGTTQYYSGGTSPIAIVYEMADPVSDAYAIISSFIEGAFVGCTLFFIIALAQRIMTA